MATFLVDNFLCIIEAAAALHLAIEGCIRRLWRVCARLRGLSDLAFRNAVADAHDHRKLIIDNANYSQELFSRDFRAWTSRRSGAEEPACDEGRGNSHQCQMREKLGDD